MPTSKPVLRQKNLVIFVLGTLSALGPFTIDMYLPSFLAIADSLGTTVNRVQLSLTSYFIGISLGQLIYGPVIDHFGRKKPLYFGLALYMVSTICCTYSTSVEMLIGLRFLQALGGCVGMVISRALVKDLFPNEEVPKVFSLLVLVIAISPIVAPTLGGYLSRSFGWQSIFYTLFALAFSIFLLASKYIPETITSKPNKTFFNIEILNNFIFVLKNKHFLVHTLAIGFVSGGLFSYIAGSPYVFIDLLGVGEERFGLVFAANAVGLIISSQLNRHLLKIVSTRNLLFFACCLQVGFGLAMMALSYFSIVSVIGLVSCIFLYLAMLGFISPNLIALALEPFTERTGVASALIGFFQMLVGASASAAISLLHNNSAWPMSSVMFTCSALSLFFIIASRVYLAKQP